jgi:hypothetical protein
MDINTHQFANYFNHYIDLVKDHKSLIDALELTCKETQGLLDLIVEDDGDYAYAEGKWTIKELLIHIIDTERIFCNRAIRFARNDKTELPGYDHDAFIAYSGAKNRKLSDIACELLLVRQSTVALFKSFDDEMLARGGKANGNDLTVLAIGFIIAGHEQHHVNVLKERYMN